MVAGALLMVAGPAAAQDTSRAEVTAGWRYYFVTLHGLQNPIELPVTNDYPEGWYADIAFNASPKFAIVGEVGGTYRTESLNRTSGSLTVRESLDIRFHTFMGGVRVRAPQVRSLVPFGQVLFGGERDESTVERSLQFGQGAPSTTLREGSSSNPVLALDGGATVMAGPIAVRGSVGYVRFFSGADADALRLNVGFGFRF
jgi:hypothetical protein